MRDDTWMTMQDGEVTVVVVDVVEPSLGSGEMPTVGSSHSYRQRGTDVDRVMAAFNDAGFRHEHRSAACDAEAYVVLVDPDGRCHYYFLEGGSMSATRRKLESIGFTAVGVGD